MMGQYAKSLFYQHFDFAVNANSTHVMLKLQIAFFTQSQDMPA